MNCGLHVFFSHSGSVVRSQLRVFIALGLVGALIALRIPQGRGEGPILLSSRDRQVISGLIRDLNRPDETARLDAVEALTWIGTPAREAVPRLFAKLKDNERRVARAAATAILEIGADHPLVVPALVAPLSDSNPEVRVEAMSTIELFFQAAEESDRTMDWFNSEKFTAILGKLGPAGKRILPAVVANLRAGNPKVREVAASLLWKIGPPARDAVPGLIERLSDPSEDVRDLVLAALVSVGPDSIAVVPALFQAMKTGDLDLQKAARGALETRFAPWGRYLELERRPAADLPALIAALADRDRRVRATSAFCLWTLREQAEPARVALTAALEDLDEEVRLKAAATLMAKAPRNPKAKAILVAALEALETTKRDLGTSAVAIAFYGDVLKHLGPEAVPAIHLLIEAGLGFPGRNAPPQRAAATQALINLGPVAVPELIRTLQGNNPVFRLNAARVLGMIGPDARASVPALVGLLDENEKGLALVVESALGKMGPAARKAIPALEQRLRAPQAPTRLRAAEILRQIDPDSRQVIPTLEEALKSSDGLTRSWAITTLGSMGPQAIRVLERVLRESKDQFDGPASYRALAAIDPSRRTPDSLLIAMLADKDREVRLGALRIAQDVGPEAKGCLHALERTLGDTDRVVRIVAEYTLVAVDPGNSPLVSHLLKVWSSNAEPHERQQAADLLGRCGAKARNALPALRSGLDEENGELQDAAAAALWHIDRNEVPIYLQPRVRAYSLSGLR